MKHLLHGVILVGAAALGFAAQQDPPRWPTEEEMEKLEDAGETLAEKAEDLSLGTPDRPDPGLKEILCDMAEEIANWCEDLHTQVNERDCEGVDAVFLQLLDIFERAADRLEELGNSLPGGPSPEMQKQLKELRKLLEKARKKTEKMEHPCPPEPPPPT